MLRNLLRTSQRLVRKEINSIRVVPFTYRRIGSVCNVYSSLLRSVSHRKYSATHIQDSGEVDPVLYDEVCSETLESLCEYFEEIVEQPEFKGGDVTYSDGVLTVDFGPAHGTYVINRQTPNKQIWLSSPVSGPKRYDLVNKNGRYWVYKHDGVTLHRLLQNEISTISKTPVDFTNCLHSCL